MPNCAATRARDKHRGCFVAAWLAMSAALPTSAYGQAQMHLPEGCGTEAELHEGVERLAGTTALVTWPERLLITEVEDEQPFELRLSLAGETRVLRDVSCQTLFRSAQVMIAATASTPPSAAEPARRERLAASAPWRGVVAAGGGAALGGVPDVGGRFQLRFRLVNGAWGVEVGGEYLAANAVAATARHPGLRISGYGARLGATAQALPWLRVFGGAELSYLRGEALQAANGAWTIAPALEAAFRVLRFGDGFLELAISGQWALVRPQFEVRGFGALYRLPPLAGAASVRLGWAIF